MFILYYSNVARDRDEAIVSMTTMDGGRSARGMGEIIVAGNDAGCVRYFTANSMPLSRFCFRLENLFARSPPLLLVFLFLLRLLSFLPNLASRPPLPLTLLCRSPHSFTHAPPLNVRVYLHSHPPPPPLPPPCVLSEVNMWSVRQRTHLMTFHCDGALSRFENPQQKARIFTPTWGISVQRQRTCSAHKKQSFSLFFNLITNTLFMVLWITHITYSFLLRLCMSLCVAEDSPTSPMLGGSGGFTSYVLAAGFDMDVKVSALH